MSIIEKALGKRGRDTSATPPASQPDTIERSAQRAASTAASTAPGSATRSGATEAPSAAPNASPRPNAPGPQTAPRPAAGLAPRQRVEVPFDALHAAGYLTPGVPRSTIAEEFRGIKRPLLRNISGSSPTPIDHANLVMVTSALQGDGKTFCSINLAMSIAMEQDKTVLFVDADVLKGSAGQRLGVPPDTPGLIDLLMDNAIEPQDVILHSSVSKLRILPAGNSSAHATELLSSDAMHQLMLELSHRYPDRVIVFDSPPLLLTTEAGVLASFMGQIVFVAAADVTPQSAVTEALQRIADDKFVGVMLNRISRRRFNFLGLGGYGGYGYGYGYGDSQERVGEARARTERSANQGKPAA